jgi:hypothetical protein
VSNRKLSSDHGLEILNIKIAVDSIEFFCDMFLAVLADRCLTRQHVTIKERLDLHMPDKQLSRVMTC